MKGRCPVIRIRKVLAAFVLAVAMLAVVSPPEMRAGTITPTLVARRNVGQLTIAVFTLVFSGSYVANGDTLNLCGFQIPGTQPPLAVFITGLNGVIYQYRKLAPAGRCTGTVKVMIEQTVATNTPLGEHTAVAYVASVTSDVVTALVIYDPLR